MSTVVNPVYTTDMVQTLVPGSCHKDTGLHEVEIVMKGGRVFSVSGDHKVIGAVMAALQADQVVYSKGAWQLAHFDRTATDITPNTALQQLIEAGKERAVRGNKDIATNTGFDIRRTQDQKALSIVILVAATVAAIASVILFVFGTVVTAPATIAVASWALTGPAIGSAVLSLLGYVGGAYLLGNAQAREEARHASTGAPVAPPQAAPRRLPPPPTHVAV